MFRLRKELFFFRFQGLYHGLVVEPKNSPRGPRLQYRERSDRMLTFIAATASIVTWVTVPRAQRPVATLNVEPLRLREL